MFASVSRKDPVETRYDRVARFYDALTSLVEWFVSRHRRELLRQARGKILEVGVGTGSSFKDYPQGKRIVAVDISGQMLNRAKPKLTNYRGNVTLRHEDIQSLSLEDGTFDTVFSSLVFCTVSDPVKGLGELHRVLRSGGKLLMLEHVGSKGRLLRHVMDRLNPWISRYSADNINRDTVDNLRKAGFKVQQDRNIVYDILKAIVAVK